MSRKRLFEKQSSFDPELGRRTLDKLIAARRMHTAKLIRSQPAMKAGEITKSLCADRATYLSLLPPDIALEFIVPMVKFSARMHSRRDRMPHVVRRMDKKYAMYQRVIIATVRQQNSTYLSLLPRSILYDMIMPMVTRKTSLIFWTSGMRRCAFCFDCSDWHSAADRHQKRCPRRHSPHRCFDKKLQACWRCAADEKVVCLWCQHPEM